MDCISAPGTMFSWSHDRRQKGEMIGFVPTMGALHEGHLNLVRLAKEQTDRVVVSIFVNPIQFGPREDFNAYPRDLERDLTLAGQEGADVVFAPQPEDMYQDDSVTAIKVRGLTDSLCGANRPGHFDGVATVAAKLFHIVNPQMAVFGRKDLQQLAVIRRMVRDLNFNIKIIGHPIIREPDGLAMSSRNIYLDSAERQQALALHRAIEIARRLVSKGVNSPADIISEINSFLAREGISRVEYVNIVDQFSMAEKKALDGDSVLALAAYVGSTRLIDNGFLITK